MANLNFNKAIIGGRLTADVELKVTPNGVSVCTFSVAVNHKVARGAEQKTDFIECVAWRNNAEFISKHFGKGSSILIVGNIQKRSWTDNNGNKRSATELHVDEACFVDSKNDGAGSSGGVVYGDTSNFEELADDDELPFV